MFAVTKFFNPEDVNIHLYGSHFYVELNMKKNWEEYTRIGDINRGKSGKSIILPELSCFVFIVFAFSIIFFCSFFWLTISRVYYLAIFCVLLLGNKRFQITFSIFVLTVGRKWIWVLWIILWGRRKAVCLVGC